MSGVMQSLKPDSPLAAPSEPPLAPAAGGPAVAPEVSALQSTESGDEAVARDMHDDGGFGI